MQIERGGWGGGTAQGLEGVCGEGGGAKCFFFRGRNSRRKKILSQLSLAIRYSGPKGGHLKGGHLKMGFRSAVRT